MVDVLERENLTVDYKPRKFIVWLFVVSSTIMFGGWTSYYIVFSASKGKGHGLVLPEVFTYSSVVLVASSLALFLAGRAFKNGNLSLQKLFLWITMGLGVVFGYLQFSAWSSLFQTGAALVNNNAAISMIYIVSGFHLLHILAGICFITACLWGAYSNATLSTRKYQMEATSIFWHFIDILWIYLYVFLLLNS
jgi:cytochrome c oxidase subunit 3